MSSAQSRRQCRLTSQWGASLPWNQCRCVDQISHLCRCVDQRRTVGGCCSSVACAAGDLEWSISLNKERQHIFSRFGGSIRCQRGRRRVVHCHGVWVLMGWEWLSTALSVVEAPCKGASGFAEVRYTKAVGGN